MLIRQEIRKFMQDYKHDTMKMFSNSSTLYDIIVFVKI